LDTVTYGLWSGAQAGWEWYKTGDATQFAQWLGEWVAGLGVGAFAHRFGGPRRAPTGAREPLPTAKVEMELKGRPKARSNWDMENGDRVPPKWRQEERFRDQRLDDPSHVYHNAPNKDCPNPYGKKGCPAHQAMIEEVIEEIRSRGLDPEREVAISTVNGQKATRFMDAVARDPVTGEIVEVHQVGRTLKSDPRVPVARERAALRDVRYSLEVRGAKRYFHEY
jgi:hypothetical protein